MKCKSLLLIFLITIYLLIGACLFALLENDPQVPSTPVPGPLLQHGKLLKQITEEFPDANKTLLMAALGIPMQVPQIIAEARTGGDPSENTTTYTTDTSNNDEVTPEMVKLPYEIRMVYWFTYSVSLLTTIGYGDVCPRTPAGKAFTLLYGSIGIPFIFICIIKLGLMFRQTTRGILNKIAHRVGALESLFKRRGHFLVEFPLHVIFYICLMVLVPSAVFFSVEGWSYGNSIYYSFISLTTVGFGDYVNNQAHLGFPLKKVLLYKILTKAWIFSALVWQACILSIIWNKLLSFPGFRGFMGPSRPAKSIVEEVPMTNGHKSTVREDEEAVSVGEEEKLNTSSEPEKEKLNTEA